MTSDPDQARLEEARAARNRSRRKAGRAEPVVLGSRAGFNRAASAEVAALRERALARRRRRKRQS